MIVFQKTVFQNIFSFGEEQTFHYDSSGIIQITGRNLDTKVTNENGEEEDGNIGSGKSSFVNLPFWALHGETVKKLGKDVVVNDKYGKDAFVHHYFSVDDVNYRVERYRKHTKHKNGLFLYEQQEEDWIDISTTDVKHTQALIDDLLLYNASTFKKAILLAREDNQAFMELNQADRGSIFDNIINLSKFKTYSTKMAKKRTALKKELVIANSDRQSKRGEIIGFRTLIYEKASEARVMKSTIGNDPAVIEKYLILKKEFDDNLLKAKAAERLCSDANKQALSLQREITTKKQLYKTLKDSECENCGHIKHDDKEQIDTLKETVNQLIIDYRETLADAKIHDAEALRLFLLVEASQEQIDALDIDLDALEVIDIEEFNKNYKGKFDSIADYRKKKAAAYEEYKVLLADYQRINQEIIKVEFWIEVFNIKEEKSIKQHIVSKIIPVFNQTLATVTDYIFDGNLSIVFDEFFNDTIIKNGHAYTYHKLSTGEKNSLSGCINKCIKDMTNVNLNPLNVIFLDEIFTSLDEINIKKFLEYFKEESEHRCIYVITHSEKVERNLEPDKRIIIQKENEDSRIIYE